MRIKELRQKMNLSQDKLAKELGLAQTTLYNYETGRNDPSVETLIHLADFFNVSVDDLIGRETNFININLLSENEAYLIRKILKMKPLELEKTKAYVMGLTE